MILQVLHLCTGTAEKNFFVRPTEYLEFQGTRMMTVIHQFSKTHRSEKLALAGGIEPKVLKNIKIYQPEIVIVGSYITLSEKPRKAIENIRNIIN